MRRPEFPEELIESIVHADWFRARVAAEQAALGRAFARWLVQDFLPSRLPGVEIPQVTELEEVVAMLAEHREEWAAQWGQQG